MPANQKVERSLGMLVGSVEALLLNDVDPDEIRQTVERTFAEHGVGDDADVEEERKIQDQTLVDRERYDRERYDDVDTRDELVAAIDRVADAGARASFLADLENCRTDSQLEELGEMIAEQPRRKAILVVEFDVSDLTGGEVVRLTGEVVCQGESSEDHGEAVAVDNRVDWR